MQTDYRNSERSGFITLMPVIMVSIFLLIVVSLSLSNSASMLEERVLKGNRQNAYLEAVHCGHWLTNIGHTIDALKLQNSSLFSQAYFDSVVLNNSECASRQVGLVESVGMYSGARFYQNFNFPLSDLYLDSI